MRSFDLFSNSISHLASKKFWVFMFFLFVLGLWFSVFCIYQWIIDPTPPLRALIMFVVRIYWCPAKKNKKKLRIQTKIDNNKIVIFDQNISIREKNILLFFPGPRIIFHSSWIVHKKSTYIIFFDTQMAFCMPLEC